MTIFVNIGHSCYCSLILFISPSLQPGGMMPVLDLKVYVVGEQFVHEYFEKPTACKYTIPYSSAHSEKMKMAVIVEEGLRRLRNHSQGLEWEKKRLVLASFSMKLMRSGYPATKRHQAIKTACVKYDKMCEDDKNGVRPIHRSRDWMAKERRLEKERKVTKWHQSQKNKVSAPLFLDPTAGNLTSEIKEACRKFELVTDMCVSVKTKAGEKVKHESKAEPLKFKGCKRDNCFSCQSGGGGGGEKNGAGR